MSEPTAGLTSPRDRAATRGYGRFVVGMLCGEVAYQIQSVAISWHIFQLRHQAFDLGLIGLFLFLPTLVFVVPAGFCADRYSRKAIIVLGQVGECALTLGLLWCVIAKVAAIAPYMELLFGLGFVRAFSSPAERTLLSRILPRERFMVAQAQYSAIRTLSVLAGPAVGGILVAWGTTNAFAVSSTLALIGGAVILGIPVAAAPRTGEPPPNWRTAADGLHFVFRQPVLAGALSLDLFAVLFGGATALLPAFAADVLHVGPTGLGLLRAAPAIGAGLMGAVLSRFPLQRAIGKTMLYVVAGFGAATIVFGLSRNFIVSIIALAVAGATDMVSVIVRKGLVQFATPNVMRGRVSAFENICIGASNELGQFESGFLAAAIGVVPSVVVGGLGTLAVIAVWSFIFPALRRADRFADVEHRADHAVL